MFRVTKFILFILRCICFERYQNELLYLFLTLHDQKHFQSTRLVRVVTQLGLYGKENKIFDRPSSGISGISKGLNVVMLWKRNLGLLQRPYTISEAAVFKE